MKPKVVPFKFTKKQNEAKGKASKSKKNYENIFNDILAGKNQLKNSRHIKKEENIELISSNITKKNKIKFISKLETINLDDEFNKTTQEKKLNKESENNNSNNKKHNINDEKNICITDNKEKKHENNIIDDYLMNKSIEKKKGKLKTETKEKYKTEYNDPAKKELLSFFNKKEKRKSLYNKDKQHNYIKCVKKMNNNNNINNNYIKSKETSVGISKKEYKRDSSQKNKLKTQSFKQNLLKNKGNKYTDKNNKLNQIGKNKKLSFPKSNKMLYNKKKFGVYENLDKITISNDNSNNLNYKDLLSIKKTVKKKRLILNNTNSNINININITNINDKNSKKEANINNKRKQSNINTDNNYNSNITTVNIINNNSISKKISSNDYRLLFYNHSNKKYLPYQTKISSKGIKIESIDINLSEEEQIHSKKKRKFRFKKNLKKNNINLNYNNINNKERIEAQSEYEHFVDLDDFWSNKSSTSYSCKSGFTASRKIRSLSKERDKIKMLNHLKQSENNKIDKIEDKLINIVNKFHIYNSNSNIDKK